MLPFHRNFNISYPIHLDKASATTFQTQEYAESQGYSLAMLNSIELIFYFYFTLFLGRSEDYDQCIV